MGAVADVAANAETTAFCGYIHGGSVTRACIINAGGLL
jgi:hypothetical protein